MMKYNALLEELHFILAKELALNLFLASNLSLFCYTSVLCESDLM